MRRQIFSAASALLAAMLSTASAPASASQTDKTDSAQADASKSTTVDLKNLPTNLEQAIKGAQSLRADGKYAEATQSLGQLMLVAPDNSRVVGEYGKALVQQGRGEEATAFLNRAVELDPNEWSYFSALGVAYDELENPKSAKLAYQHALLLKPGEASVLNNIAISRMLSGDIAGAHQMIVQAQAAGGGDEKIAQNVALIESRMSAAPHVASSTPVPTVQKPDSNTVAALPPTRLPVVTQALSAPRPLGKDVVMQPVPADPSAGPVAKAKPAKHFAAAHPTPAMKKPIATVDKKSKTPSLRMSADAS